MLAPATKERELYIPAGPRPAKPVLQVARVPRTLAVVAARSVFRTVHWDGAVADTVAQTDVKSRERTVVDATAKTRKVFVSVAWTGEKPSVATSFQQERSLRAVFSNFEWE